MKKSLLILLLVMGIFISGCGNKEAEETQTPQDYEEMEKDDKSAKEKDNKGKNAEETFDFAELKNQEFYFASGVGGWSTELVIREDGTFSGIYSDTDLGDSGEGYPNGTCYLSEFCGKFSKAVKVNSYTYSTEIKEISFTNDVGTSEIKDGMLYNYSEPYGISGAEELLIYLPGAPVDELPVEYVSWVRMSIDESDELPFYGLYNVTCENGFSSYDIMERLERYLDSAQENSDEIEDSLQNEVMTQLEMNTKSQELYELWDDTLNYLWGNVKNMMDEDEFASLTNEQIEWIEEKEKISKEAGKEVEGGSMYPLLVNTKAAELTKERVYEIYEMLK